MQHGCYSYSFWLFAGWSTALVYLRCGLLRLIAFELSEICMHVIRRHNFKDNNSMSYWIKLSYRNMMSKYRYSAYVPGATLPMYQAYIIG